LVVPFKTDIHNRGSILGTKEETQTKNIEEDQSGSHFFPWSPQPLFFQRKKAYMANKSIKTSV